MSYENAPATRMLAIHCVACGRPLVDAISANTGMGPDCREKYGHAGPDDATAAARDDVNARVHELALGVDPKVAVGHLLIIRAHGFAVLADKLEERLCAVQIEPVGSMLAITTPYVAAFVSDLKSVPGRRWDAAAKQWLVPAVKASKDAAWGVIRRHFSGQIGRGPQGLFPI